MATYAVRWREPDGQHFVGRLSFGAAALRLDGRQPDAKGSAVVREFGYEDLRSPRSDGTTIERLDGRPAVVVDGADGRYLIASVGLGGPIVQEIVDRLAHARATAFNRATVVLPLREGASERVRELVAKGPPFDPSEMSLTRHEILLTSREAIFVFEAATESVAGLLMLLSQLAEVGDAAAAWAELLGGPPRLADVVFAWERAGEGSPSVPLLRRSRP